MQLLQKNTGGKKELMHCPMPHTILQKIAPSESRKVL